MIWREDGITAILNLRCRLEGQWRLEWARTLVRKIAVLAPCALTAENKLWEGRHLVCLAHGCVVHL